MANPLRLALLLALTAGAALAADPTMQGAGPTPTPVPVSAPLPLPVDVVSGASTHDAVWIALITGMVTIAGSIITAVLAFAATRQSARNARELAVISTQATEIRTTTNGMHHALQAQRDLLDAELAAVRRQLATALESKIEAAGVAAQAASDVRSAQAATPPKTHNDGEDGTR